MSVVLVDWLGRGGIAQTTEAWAIELEARGIAAQVVTRPGRELGSGAVSVRSARGHRWHIAAHHAVAEEAARTVRELRPSAVVVQNYVVPALERRVYAAARSVCARVVVVVHDHRLHTWRAGTSAGLGRVLKRSDTIVAHSDFVASRIERSTGRSDVAVIPHPAQVGMLRHDRMMPEFGRASGSADLLCGHFGVVHRRYKGGDIVGDLAADDGSGWRFVVAGVGAETSSASGVAVAGYLSPGLLVGLVDATDATLLPYRAATQSGAVVLSHLLGSVPIASAVGGIPEQIEHAVDGILVPAGASLDAWREALCTLRDDTYRMELARAGVARAWRDHELFAQAVAGLVA